MFEMMKFTHIVKIGVLRTVSEKTVRNTIFKYFRATSLSMIKLWTPQFTHHLGVSENRNGFLLSISCQPKLPMLRTVFHRQFSIICLNVNEKQSKILFIPKKLVNHKDLEWKEEKIQKMMKYTLSLKIQKLAKMSVTYGMFFRPYAFRSWIGQKINLTKIDYLSLNSK